jgi:hypothetical protein
MAMAFKDWFSITLSCAALAVSAGSAYLNLLVQKDDLRVVIGRSPSVGRTDQNELTVYGEQELTFINSGNRAAAVTTVSAAGKRYTEPKAGVDQCSGGTVLEDLLILPFIIEPFVLKPGEILAIKAKVDTALISSKGKFGVAFAKMFFHPKVGDKALACLSLNVVTPDSYSVEWRRAAYIYTFQEDVTDREQLFESEKPISVVHRTQWWPNW